MHDDWPSPAFRAWMEEHMPRDEPKPMTRERLAEIRDSMESERKFYDDQTMALPERWYFGMTAELLAEIDRLRSLQDDDTALLDWASTNFADHATTICVAVKHGGYTLRDALRDARDGTLYEDDDDE